MGSARPETPVWDATQKVRIQQDNTNPPPVKDARINNDLGWANMATCEWDVALVEQNPNQFNISDASINKCIGQLIIFNVQAA